MVLLMLLLVAVILIFILENQQVVSLSFLGFTFPYLPVSALLVMALLLGLLLGPVMGVLVTRLCRNKLRMR
nr:lipopolysaccharide assembly protein LapA domain-containing protein [Pseudomonas moorei]